MAQPTLPQGNTPNNNSNNSNSLNFNNTPSTTDNSVSSSGTELGEPVILSPGLETLATIIMDKLTFSTKILEQAALEITHTQKGDNNPVTGRHRTSINMVVECKCGLDPYTFAQQHLQHLPSQDLQSAVNLLQTIFDSFLPTPEEIARQAAMKYDEDQSETENSSDNLSQSGSDTTQQMPTTKQFIEKAAEFCRNATFQDFITPEAYRAFRKYIMSLNISPQSANTHTDHNNTNTQLENVIVATHALHKSQQRDEASVRRTDTNRALHKLQIPAQQLAKGLVSRKPTAPQRAQGISKIVRILTEAIDTMGMQQQKLIGFTPDESNAGNGQLSIFTSSANSENMNNQAWWSPFIEAVCTVLEPLNQNLDTEQIRSMEDMRQTIIATVEEAMVRGRLSSEHQILFITHIEKAFEAKERFKGDTRDVALKNLLPDLLAFLKSALAIATIQSDDFQHKQIRTSTKEIFEQITEALQTFSDSHSAIPELLKLNNISPTITNTKTLRQITHKLARLAKVDDAEPQNSTDKKQKQKQKQKQNKKQKPAVKQEQSTASKTEISTIAAASNTATTPTYNPPPPVQCAYCKENKFHPHTTRFPHLKCYQYMFQNSNEINNWTQNSINLCVVHFLRVNPSWKQTNFPPEFQASAERIISEAEPDHIPKEQAKEPAWKTVRGKDSKSKESKRSTNVAALTSDIDTPKNKQSENAFDIFADSDSSDSDSD